MDWFSSLIDMRESVDEEMNTLLMRLCDCDNECEGDYPDIALARKNMERVLTDFRAVFSESLIKSIREQQAADIELANQFDE